MGLGFIIIGGEKCGTTLLVELLRRSPEIAMPDREVRYFRDPFFPNREYPDQQFTSADIWKLRGIKHPSYLGRPEVPKRIAAHAPKAKLIAILRDPVKRTLASYLHYVRHGQIPCIHPNEGIPQMFAAPDASSKYRDIIAFGEYAKYLELYLALFPRQQLLVLEQEAFVRDPSGVERLFDFLGVARPEISWPLPRVNDGGYDWDECRRMHHLARAHFDYDEWSNIVGEKPQTPAPLPQSGEGRPVWLSDDATSLLQRHYRDERRRLETACCIRNTGRSR